MTSRWILLLLLAVAPVLQAADSVAPYTSDSVPQSATELWSDVDFRKDPLDTEVIREWNEDGVVCRYVLFTVGTFKGAESRCAAFYTFPEGMSSGPAFVWAHGGGQRAERQRGKYFAQQGYATIDFNWGGRELVEGIEPNTDWGKVDPSQGPQFYPGALRPSVKLNLLPDEHTIDPVVSPRNGIWYLLAYAGRRAITFLEQQPEVDPDKIGFAGFSMGGNITSMTAIDPRLKAVIPMVGGSGFIMEDFPGLPNTGRARGFKHVDLYNQTIDAQAYWPHVSCPVLFLNASDDFHGVFDNVYRSLNLLPHTNLAASHLMHYNHGLGPQQWVLVDRWFDRYLKHVAIDLPKTVTPEFAVTGDRGRFTVTPDRVEDVVELDIYYSHDANARARFWTHAETGRDGDRWSADVPVRKGLPLYAFANITYSLGANLPSLGGPTDRFTITSGEVVRIPPAPDSVQLRSEARHITVFEDFEVNGLRDWGLSPRGGISTFKFQDPARKTPSKDHAMSVRINVPREKLSYRFQITKRKFLAGVTGPQENFFATRNPKPGDQQTIVLRVSDFADREGKLMTDWDEISTLRFSIYDGADRVNLHFNDPANEKMISRIEWVTD